MEKIEVGDNIPEFCLTDQEGREVCNGDLMGKWTVLYFYPKDNTPGCTREAKDFSCEVERFGREGARIIGISPDPEKSHLNFIGRHELKLTLLSDPEHSVLGSFGAWRNKKMYGREFMGVERSTFLIDPEGRIKKIWRKVKVPGHVDDVLETLTSLKGSN